MSAQSVVAGLDSSNYVHESLRLSFPCTVAQGDRFVLVLHGYFDESGTHRGSEAVSVAGYLSTPEQWEAFEADWRAALDEYGIERFHMADFTNRAKEYNSWTDQERRFRLARLIHLINKHTLASVGFVVPKRACEGILTKAAQNFCGGAYGMAAISCFLEAPKLLAEKYPSARIAYVFESGAAGAGEILKIFQWNDSDPVERERLKLLSLKFEGKEFVPLQAADILAYELYRHLPQKFNREQKHASRVENLRMLSEPNERVWAYLDKRELRKLSAVVSAAERYHRDVGTKRTPRKQRRRPRNLGN